MKIALAQINPIVGDLSGNGKKIIDYAHQGRSQGADLVIFPEMCVVGYPPQDLLENPLFIAAVQRSIQRITAAVPADLGVILGAPIPNPASTGKRLFNAALLYEGGRQLGQVHKTLLPTDVHDAIALGLHDYFHKTGAFKKAVLGLSGGIDSAVTCALAVSALGAERVVGVAMPGLFLFQFRSRCSGPSGQSGHRILLHPD